MAETCRECGTRCKHINICTKCEWEQILYESPCTEDLQDFEKEKVQKLVETYKKTIKKLDTKSFNYEIKTEFLNNQEILIEMSYYIDTPKGKLETWDDLCIDRIKLEVQQ